MNKNIKTTIDTISSVVNVMTDNLTTYANKALGEIKNMKPEIESEIKPVLGYDTGNQGWYDMLGGGPCDNYCRYTGISPNVQWTCSNEKDLSKLMPTPIEKTGRFCYGYDKKTTKPPKTGAVIKGSFVSTEDPANNVQESENYNFVIYNNKDGDGIDNFDNTEKYITPNSNEIENFENVTTSCYGAPGTTCNTCNDVVNAYKNANWVYDTKNFAQCNIPSSTTSCYGAPGASNCSTCNEVVNAYKNANWAYDTKNFAQCDATSVSSVNKNLQSTDTRWQGPQKMDYPYNDIKSFSINQVSDCGIQCYNTPKCVGFVTTDASDYCWLKSALGSPNAVPNRNTYTIDRNPPSTDPRWSGPLISTNYLHNDLGKVPINKISDCGEACAKNPKCKGFVTSNDGTQCYLKSDLVVQPNPDWNAYKMNAHYDTVKNVSLKECENLCQNNDNCKGFNYDTAKKSCAISAETIKPTSFDTNSISGNKKVHMALNGTYNIYQNNSCINSTLFDKNANVSASLGIATNDNGVPIIPQQPICPNQLNNNFIFGKNYEIMALDTDTLETNTVVQDCDFWDWGCHTTSSTADQNVNDARCLQVNSDGSVSKENCTYTDNQKWTYDENINSIRTWDGDCLNVDTSGQTIKVSTKPCINDVNQKFYLKSVAENLQPKNFTVLDGFDNLNNDNNTNIKEKFATNTCINNYLSNNRDSQDYLYKLPYSAPYVKNINNIKENFESNENNTVTSIYLLYLIVLILLLLVSINRK